MERRLIKHGPSSMIVVIPAAWSKERSLKPGDAVQVHSEGDKLIITPNAEPKITETTISADGLDRTSLKLLIRALYRQGFSRIVVNYGDNMLTHYRIGSDVTVPSAVLQEVLLLIGMEITEQRKGRIVIQEITRPAAGELPNLYRKVFTMVHHLILSLAERGDDPELDLESRHDLVMKIISYAMRILNQGETNLSTSEKLKYSHTFSMLGILINTVKYYSRSADGKQLSEAQRKFVLDLAELFKLVESCVFSNDQKTMHRFEQKKHALRMDPVPGLLPVTDVLTHLIVLHATKE